MSFPRVKGRARTQPKRDGSMNKMERDFSLTLEASKRTGQIAEYAFQPEKLRLADRTFYEPDFRVIMPNGAVRFYETKGHWEDDARVKIKVAAEMHPYEFIAVTRVKGEWKYEAIG